VALYLVTGGCGFIGSHLCEALLASGHRVRILDDLSTGKIANRPAGAELVRGDVADRELVGRAMADVAGCFHLAAVASVERGNKDWLGTHRTNLTGTIAVLDAARECGRVPVVYASSAAVYGDNKAVPLDEDAATRPLSAYGADKLACELHARVATAVHGVPAIGLRFFNVFGPRQDPSSPYSGVISIFCDRLRDGRPVAVHGDGSQTRDFIYVADVVRGLVAAMDRLPTERTVFNLCTGRATSIVELAEAIARASDVELEITHAPPRHGDIHTSFGSPRAVARHLNWCATYSLEEGLQRTLQAQLSVGADQIGARQD
jgi:UDP-glucose 4-epimerase